jgi:probable F420-dependent oxidoreductase
MKYGVSVGNFGGFGRESGLDACIAVARKAEELGFDSVWAGDHIVLPADRRTPYPYSPGGSWGISAETSVFEPLTVLSALAVATERVLLGTGVLVVPYRDPLILANTVATVDRLSHGRVMLGVGVGWMLEEFEALGVGERFHQRGAITDEWLRICRTAWEGRAGDGFSGRFRSFPASGGLPAPYRGRRLPVMVGGNSEAAVKRAARLGDGLYTITSTPDQVRQQLQLLHAEAERVGRDSSTMEVLIAGILGTARSKEHAIDRLNRFADAGLTHVIGVPSLAAGQDAKPQDRLEGLFEDMAYFMSEIRPHVS